MRHCKDHLVISSPVQNRFYSTKVDIFKKYFSERCRMLQATPLGCNTTKIQPVFEFLHLNFMI